MTSNSDPTDLTRFLLALCEGAGDAIAPFFRNLKEIDNKLASGFDPVTEADRAAERTLRRMIEAQFPADGILGEEYGPKPSRSGRTWVLDPIDGTRAFVCGLPTWMTLIGLVEEDRAVFGAAHQSFVGETFIGGPDGAFAYRAGTRIARLAAAPPSGLSESRGGTTGPARYRLGDKRRLYDGLLDVLRDLRHDADAYFFVMIAAGQVDLAIDTGLQTYDIAALIPIIRGAGGCVTTWSGGDPLPGGDIIATAGPALHQEALAFIADHLSGDTDPTKVSNAAQN